MFNKVDHVGIATKSLFEIKQIFEGALGLKPEFEEEVKDQKVRVVGYKIGETNLEFLEPISDDSPIAKFIEKKGPGLHHLALNVSDINDSLSRFKANDLRLIDETPRKGAEGKLIAFVHPKSTGGVLLELSQEED
ncbi:MAG: methylmalonyl-CoA epimerase [Calditrichia bacterium]